MADNNEIARQVLNPIGRQFTTLMNQAGAEGSDKDRTFISRHREARA